MTKRRKHRLVIDVTFSSEVSRRNAAKGLRLVLDRLDLQAKPVWGYAGAPCHNRMRVLETRLRRV